MERVRKFSTTAQEYWPTAKTALISTGHFLETLVSTPKRIILTGIVLAWMFALMGISELMWSMVALVAMIVAFMMLTSAGSTRNSRKSK